MIDHVSSRDGIILHVRHGRVLAEEGPLMARGRTMDEALARLDDARRLYRLLLVCPDSSAAQRLASEINELYAA